MLKIKLTRLGKRNQPHYRVVVNEAKTRRDGKYVDLLGHYNPLANPAEIVIDMEKYASWLKKGAQPTETVAHLAKKAAK
jgi:small subunit ribosomal protein S16